MVYKMSRSWHFLLMINLHEEPSMLYTLNNPRVSQVEHIHTGRSPSKIQKRLRDVEGAFLKNARLS